MVGNPTTTHVVLGLNMKGVSPTNRLTEMPSGGMCQYTVKVAAAAEVDAELCGWLKYAYDHAE
ncbi:MAG TPA: hypothetical protein PLD47_08600 [Aggregatilineales bacterium]|nr:hypothetical protein [Anaerolineales bacterium]HRE47771.1 hypothetical protein [Aggregatilineales bacterium]